jgi:hypothetical protein
MVKERLVSGEIHWKKRPVEMPTENDFHFINEPQIS